MSEIAEELSRRASSDYIKGKAKDMARRRTGEVAGRIGDNPAALALVMGAIGAYAGKMLSDRLGRRYGFEGEERRRFGARHYREPYYGREYYGGYYRGGPGYRKETVPPQGESYREYYGEGRHEEGEEQGRLKEAAEGVKEKVEEVKEKLGEKAEQVREGIEGARERMPTGEQLRERATEQPMLWAIGAFVLGALFATLVPLSTRERHLGERAKERVREAGEKAMESAKAFGRGVQEGMRGEVH